MKFSDLVARLVSDPVRASLFVDLTQQATAYVSRRVLRQDSSAERAKLQEYLGKFPELEGVEPTEFARGLVMYLYRNRRSWDVPVQG